jgi:hypothetical protein
VKAGQIRGWIGLRTLICGVLLGVTLFACQVDVVVGHRNDEVQRLGHEIVSAYPCLVFEPGDLVFRDVPLGENRIQSVWATNRCHFDVEIGDIAWAEKGLFGVSFVDEPSALGEEGGPLTVPAASGVGVEIAYEAIDMAYRKDSLSLHSPLGGFLGELSVRSNPDGPCLQVSSPAVDFGCQLAGTVAWRPLVLTPCGEGDVVILNTRVEPVGRSFFLQEGLENTRMGPEQSRELMVGYGAEETSLRVAPDWRDATLVVDVDGYASPFQIPLRGFGKTVSCDAIRVELVWSTPGDLEPKDHGPESGADLDLHLRHPFAVGWFDIPFDSYWSNASPDWGVLGRERDDPRLGQDDVDGLGPETMLLRLPDSSASYGIGVHYWNDHFFGPSYAQIRIHIFGQWVAESPLVELLKGDLWEVGFIVWPKGEVHWTVGDGDEPVILSNHAVPCSQHHCTKN